MDIFYKGDNNISDASLDDSIQNVKGVKNNPDTIRFFGRYYCCEEDDTNKNFEMIPFIALNILDRKIYYGSQFEFHEEIGQRILIDILSRYDIDDIDEKYPEYNAKLNAICQFARYGIDPNVPGNASFMKFAKTVLQSFNVMFRDNVPSSMVGVLGRVFIIPNETTGKKYAIFTFWSIGTKYASIERCQEILEQVLKDNPSINGCNGIYIANGKGPYIEYKHDTDLKNDDYEFFDDSEEQAIHLMNAKKKREKLQPFRDEKEKKLGDKLAYRDDEGNKTGREMPLAQWRALRYVDENKTNKKMKINEEQLRQIIKESLSEWGNYDFEDMKTFKHRKYGTPIEPDIQKRDDFHDYPNTFRDEEDFDGLRDGEKNHEMNAITKRKQRKAIGKANKRMKTGSYAYPIALEENNMKINEQQLREIIRESIQEVADNYIIKNGR